MFFLKLNLIMNLIRVELLLLRPLKMGRNFVFGCVLAFFFFFFHAKSVTTINNRTGLNDISY